MATKPPRKKRSEQPDAALVAQLDRQPKFIVDLTKRHEVTVVDGVVHVRELGPHGDK